MLRFLALTILGCLLAAAVPHAEAATSTSNWASLDADAAHSNYNGDETALTAKNVLKLKVRWSAPISDASYPVVYGGSVYAPYSSNGKIHVHVLEAATGKVKSTIFKDARGGLLVTSSALFIAGKTLQAFDPATGEVLGTLKGSPHSGSTFFIDPQTDGKIVAAGYEAGAHSSIYTVDPGTIQILQRLPSSSAVGAMVAGHILTADGAHSAFYDAATGRALAKPAYLGSDWFAGGTLGYTVASVKGKPAAINAVDGSGQRIWSRTIAPLMATQSADWPHAIGPNILYLQTFKPRQGVVALDELSGHVLWQRAVANDVQGMVLAGNLLYVLTYSLGQTIRLEILDANLGKVLGSVALSDGYYGFGSPNDLIVADGMVFIRAIGPGGPQLVALGLPKHQG